MCNLYEVTPSVLVYDFLAANGRIVEVPDYAQHYVGPFQQGLFLRPKDGQLIAQVGQWGLIRPGQPEPIDYMPSKVPGKKGRPRSTNNARIEGIEKKVTFRQAWAAGQRCLIPANWYQEPNWETGKNIWWQLRRADGTPWMLAGLWSEWTDLKTGEVVPNFTMITTNCDNHPLLKRLHKPEVDKATGEVLPPEQQDKRSLIQIDPADYDAWLNGSEDEARSLIKPPALDAIDQRVSKETDEKLASLF